MTETQAQQEQRIHQLLNDTRLYIEQDITTTHDINLKRIEIDAATVVTLSIVSEMLPESVQQQVKAIIDLHEQVWNMDIPSTTGMTPRKPLGQRFFHRFAFFHPAMKGNGLSPT
ncbi:hypothetical protein KDA_00420 [Dictyobacter alpinus]|uniref:Uncharacterized protein n=1 Tax=Dictyobacter alpinus TaxID=2014873 RepID=A0A402AZP9_9CHLR|nr:hypothetical protein [Dictyobacter alpinus]GCE24558.1 hypothetical protein KDA_00420 [Dictyobacter alpinus]